MLGELRTWTSGRAAKRKGGVTIMQSSWICLPGTEPAMTEPARERKTATLMQKQAKLVRREMTWRVLRLRIWSVWTVELKRRLLAR